MMVHPQYQRRGVGSALMSRVLEIADSTNTPIFIRDATLAGMPLYLANGFKQVDTLRMEYKGQVVEMGTLLRPAKNEGSKPS
jgi:GNAT superfamily N-acetyltransferase